MAGFHCTKEDVPYAEANFKGGIMEKRDGMERRQGTRRKVIRVYCYTCAEWINEEDAEFLTIDVEIGASDKLTFICHQCGTTQNNFKIGGWDSGKSC